MLFNSSWLLWPKEGSLLWSAPCFLRRAMGWPETHQHQTEPLSLM